MLHSAAAVAAATAGLVPAADKEQVVGIAGFGVPHPPASTDERIARPALSGTNNADGLG